ncbi:hypothetical protein [Streptomyces sp. NPDC002588]
MTTPDRTALARISDGRLTHREETATAYPGLRPGADADADTLTA